MRRREAIATLAACLALGAAAGAQAQDQDTELTPVPKPAGQPGPAFQWKVLAGARFEGNGRLFDDSPTPYTVDFFSTAFPPPDPDPNVARIGFFAGAQCEKEGGETTPFDELEDCEREPAIYRLAEDERGDQKIERVPGVGGGSGFVGAVAWIDSKRALAVGGDGTYPRREPATPVDTPGYIDPAGDARAWLYENESWRELKDLPDGTPGDGIPDQMAGMTALACGPTGLPGRCLAGGLQRLWWWEPPGAVARFDATPVRDVPNAAGQPDFRFRARAIQFRGWPYLLTPLTRASVLVATSGCCASPGSALTGPRILSYDPAKPAQNRWTSPPTLVESGPGRAASEAIGSTGSAALADSYYGLADSVVIASPGGPQTQGATEPGSRIIPLGHFFSESGSGINNKQVAGVDPTDRALDAVRLLAADGDFDGAPSPGNEVVGNTGSGNTGPDDLPDWSVGRLKMRELGIAYTTVPALAPVPNPLVCTLRDAQDDRSAEACEPVPESLTEASTASKRLVGMGTYALNAFSFVPSTYGGEAWAAGDRGALARLGGGGGVGGRFEPPAPFIRARGATPLADREPFDSYRPVTSATPGAVPPLSDQPHETMEEPALVPYGSANPMPPLSESTSGFAMARDGSQGWAVGTDPYHFDGERWVRCAQEALPPSSDAACDSLLTAAGGAELRAIARVPLERDGDPTNDKEFAAIALGRRSGGDASTVALTYGNGSWASDTRMETELENAGRNVRIAFRTPDDGWLTATDSGGGTSHLFHYGGKWPYGQWHDCGTADGGGSFDIAQCGEGVSSLPLGNSGQNLQTQIVGDTVFVAGIRRGNGGTAYPFVAAKDLGSNPPTPWRMEYDPGCPESQNQPPRSAKAPTCSGSPDAEKLGTVSSFSVVQLGDKGIAGWLLGRFGAAAGTGFGVATLDATREVTGQDMLMRRDPASGKWGLRTVEDAAADFLPTGRDAPKVMSFTGPNGEERSVIIPDNWLNTGRHPWLAYDPDHDRWRGLPTPFVSNLNTDSSPGQAAAIASDPDGQGGFWAAVRQGLPLTPGMPDEPQREVPVYYYHYTDRRPKPVFEDAPSPVREPISAIDGTADGTVWVSTYSNNTYRYDRITGWERAGIPGWDPGRTVTRPSATYALAVNDAGVGVAVGKEGRVADISPDSVRLDPASGRRCSDVPPPCGTPRDLRAAAVAPDGSALVGGDNLTLMWRPAGGDFLLASGPRISLDTSISDIAMPEPGRAWITTRAGEVWAGTLDGEEWSWEIESPASAAADETGWARLNAIEVDAGRRGLAVGARGAMLERSPDGSWTRLNTGYLDDLYSIALPPSGYGDGTLVGGSVGVVLTRVNGSFHIARRSDVFDPVTNGSGAPMAARIVGVALAGGDSEGEAEAWAASQIPVEAWSRRDPPPGALLHYANGEDPLLDSRARAGALPDAPPQAPDELAFAVFGRSECQLAGRPRFCPEFQGANMFSEVVTRRIQDEVGARAADTEGGLAALFTGDINTAPGREEQWGRSLSVVGRPNTPLDVNATHDTWRDLVAEPLMEDGVPLFSALGKADLSGVSECVNPVTCPGTRDVTNAALSLQWRQSFADMPSPWGDGSAFDAGRLEFDPVGETLLADVEAPGGGAKTHYAADVVRDGERIARLVVLDNSLGALSVSTVNQNPVEDEQSWLEGMLCFDGSAEDTDGDVRDCTREPGQEAIVLANYPTYTYATNISPTDVATDGAALEATLLRNDVDVLIAGRLGWNGLYYACAPGLHYPAPGQGYPERSPESLAECAAAAGGLDAPRQLAELASEGAGAVSGTPTGALPVVVASGAGGRFGPRGDSDGTASQGFWRGYSVVRLDPDTGEVIVEQRPVVDWVGLTTPELSLQPRERIELHGYAREPAAIDVPLRYIDIDSPAVTHRYDLLLADPEEPWVPCEAGDEGCRELYERLGGSRSFDSAQDDNDGGYRSAASAASGGTGECEPYLCLPENVAMVDDQTGEVRAGNGKYPDTFAIAMLSMGERSATQALVFKKSPSFIVNPVRLTLGPPIQTASAASTPSTAPPPPVPKPSIPQPKLPELPALPGIPPLSAAQPPEPQPPAPPAPPPPTEQPSPLDLTVSPTALTVATPAAVIQPPTPPVNPAPPGGARREARQRQAATQKSGADSSEGSKSGIESEGGDLAQGRLGPAGSAYTRHDHSFTAISRADDSSLAPALLYTGGITAMALVLAFGFTHGRPTPRRRLPEVPAPAVARARRGR